MVRDCPHTYSKKWIQRELYDRMPKTALPANGSLDIHRLLAFFNAECIEERNFRYDPTHPNRRVDVDVPISEQVSRTSLSYHWSHATAYPVCRAVDFIRAYWSVNLLKDKTKRLCPKFYDFNLLDALHHLQCFAIVSNEVEHEDMQVLRERANFPSFLLNVGGDMLPPNTAIREEHFDVPYVGMEGKQEIEHFVSSRTSQQLDVLRNDPLLKSYYGQDLSPSFSSVPFFLRFTFRECPEAPHNGA